MLLTEADRVKVRTLLARIHRLREDRPSVEVEALDALAREVERAFQN